MTKDFSPIEVLLNDSFSKIPGMPMIELTAKDIEELKSLNVEEQELLISSKIIDSHPGSLSPLEPFGKNEDLLGSLGAIKVGEIDYRLLYQVCCISLAKSMLDSIKEEQEMYHEDTSPDTIEFDTTKPLSEISFNKIFKDKIYVSAMYLAIGRMASEVCSNLQQLQKSNNL